MLNKIVFPLILLFAVSVFAADPIGNLDSANENSASGWAYDADAGATAITVHIYLDGEFYQAVTADEPRSDIVGVVPDPNHGFTVTFSGLSDGGHSVVAYALDVGGSVNTRLTGSPRAFYNGDTTSTGDPERDLYRDTWVATDAVGRKLQAHSQVGGVRADKFVGLFYWIWHTGGDGPYDVTEILKDDPEDREWGAEFAPHHWSQSELGYYISSDPYIYHRHAHQLANAGVDVIIFDTTNTPFTWPEHYLKLCEVFLEIRRDGGTTPQIAFLAPFWDPEVVVTSLYDNLYSPGLFPSLWFEWDGKPLIMADPDKINDPDIKNFFTFRKPEPSYFVTTHEADEWGWLEVYPQRPYYNSDGDLEQAVVGVAQNATDTELKPMSLMTGIHGRSWHDGAIDTSPNAVDYGFNFTEQWERALELDPEFIFITGWNEWIAGRFFEWQGVTGDVFPDQFDQEYSRDIEPMVGGHGDNYYYQMTDYIRKFKGMEPRQRAGDQKPITIDGDMSDWDEVEREYRDVKGDTVHRDFRGWTTAINYTNDTGRNDIVTAKTTYDEDNIYFFVETVDSITDYSDEYWMLLFIDADQDAATGYRGYDYLVNSAPTDSTTTNLVDAEANPVGTIQYRVTGNQLELAIPRNLIDQTSDVAFDFHWGDNIKPLAGETEPFNFGVNGDNAPDRRFNYRFTANFPTPCGDCLGGATSCDEACNGVMGGTGHCEWPESVEAGKCCICYDVEIPDDDSVDEDNVDEDNVDEDVVSDIDETVDMEEIVDSDDNTDVDKYEIDEDVETITDSQPVIDKDEVVDQEAVVDVNTASDSDVDQSPESGCGCQIIW